MKNRFWKTECLFWVVWILTLGSLNIGMLLGLVDPGDSMVIVPMTGLQIAENKLSVWGEGVLGDGLWLDSMACIRSGYFSIECIDIHSSTDLWMSLLTLYTVLNEKTMSRGNICLE